MLSWVIGIDLGGTKIEIALFDPQDQIAARKRIPTLAEQGPAAVVDRIAATIAELEAGIPGGERAAALGICSPGPLDHTKGTLIKPTNLPKFHNTPLQKLLSDRLGIPVSLEHDAKAAALGEFFYGTGRDESSMVYTVVGTGVGSAILLDGRLIRGMHNFAGEAGHSTVDRDGELCPCGSRGCVETYTSGPWLARRYLRAQPVSGEDPERMTGETVARLAGQGDPLAARIMQVAGKALGIMVATMAMILDIELFVFGGGVSRAGDLLFEPARSTLPRYAFESVSSRVHIVPTQLGDDGPLLGCCWLARQLKP